MYCWVFGLAEHFKKLLQDSVSGPFVVLFDESLNTKMQQKQMDAHVRFWNDQTKSQQDISTMNFLVSVESFIMD